MMKIMLEQWDKNEANLKQALSELKEFPGSYLELVKLAFETVYNTDIKKASTYGRYEVDCSKITEIDDGDYQGTLIYLIPFKTYQPCEFEYLMTYAGYGSCSGCDALQAIGARGHYGAAPNEEQQEDLLGLCRDILMDTIKPYNSGWRDEEGYTQVEFEGGNT